MQGPSRARWLIGIAWLVVAAGGGWLIARQSLQQRQADFETDARIAHRLLSQQVVQYDAVLATLARLAPPDPTRLQDVYRSIAAVQRRGPGEAWPDPALAEAEAASRRLGRAVVVAPALGEGGYGLVAAGDGVAYAMRIALPAATVWRDWPMDLARSPVRVAIEHGGQRFVVQPGRADDTGRWVFGFSKPLASASQPFDVVAERRVGWAELPWLAIGGWAAGSAAVVAALAAWQRQRTARRRAEALLRFGQVARLNSLGELAAGVAHELNQPLTAVMASTQAARRLLDDEPPELDEARGAMAHAVAQARRASEVVGRLRRLIERPAAEADAAAAVRLDEAAARVLDLLEPECRRRAVAVQLDASPVPVRADAVAVEQILHNLLTNALQSLDEVPAAERRLALQVRAQAGEGVLVVDDTGRGLPPEVLPHVFEPFFSTRRGGLGLGLSLCETQAQAMGGRLSAADRPPRGARFELRLPLVAGGAAA